MIGEPVTVGERCLLANHVVFYEGVRIGDDCVIEDRVRIGYNSTIGARARLAAALNSTNAEAHPPTAPGGSADSTQPDER